MSHKHPVRIHVIYLAIIFCMLLWVCQIGPWVDSHEVTKLEMVAPDGRYTCKIVEKYAWVQENCKTYITLYHDGKIIEDFMHDNDSAGFSDYSLVWQYDAEHKTTGAIVFVGGRVYFSYTLPQGEK